MNRRTRTNLFLALMVGVLGAGVYAELRREDAIAIEPVTSIDPARVKDVRIACVECSPRHFRKVDGHWRMLEPFAEAADDARIERIAAIARAPVRFRHAANELDAKRLGLDPPWATLRLDDAVMTFGTTDAIHGDRYVRVGDTIALVPDRFSALLFTKPESELAQPVPATRD
jgi:hypothetical protein